MNIFVIFMILGLSIAEEANKEGRDKRGSSRGHSTNYLLVGGGSSGHHGTTASDVAHQAAAQASAALEGLDYAGKAAAGKAAIIAAVIAAAASQAAQVAANDRKAQAVLLTHAAQKAQTVALSETALAAASAKAEKASDIAAAMAKGFLGKMEEISGESNILVKKSGSSLKEQQDFLEVQSYMTLRTQQAANTLRQQQAVALHELISALKATKVATAAAEKAKAKAKGANAGGFLGYSFGGAYH